VEDAPMCRVDKVDVPIDGVDVSMTGVDAPNSTFSTDGIKVLILGISCVPKEPRRLSLLPLPLPLPPAMLSVICMHKIMTIIVECYTY